MNSILRYHGKHQRRGSALVMVVIISVVITGLVMTMAWAGGVQAQMTANLMKVDQAYYTAEAGLQRVAWYCKNGKMGTITSPLTGTLGSYAYSASWVTVSGSTIRITSRGSLGSVEYTCYQTVTPPSSPGTMLTVGGNMDISNVHVTGDVMITGNATTSQGATANVTGNLTYGGTFDATHITVTGTKTHASSSMPTIDYTSLQSSAALTYNSSQTNKVFDFTLLPGPNPVIYVAGNVTNPTVIGSGTIVASGTIGFGGSIIGTAIKPVYFVSESSMSIDGTLTLTGGLYAKTQIALNADYQITGPLVCGGYVSNSGSGNTEKINSGTLPSFDPRSGGVGGGRTNFTSFAGPLP